MLRSVALMSPLLLSSRLQIVRQVQIHRHPQREFHPHACPAPPVRKPSKEQFCSSSAYITCPFGKNKTVVSGNAGLFMHMNDVFSMGTHHALHICAWESPLDPCFTGCRGQRALKQANSPAAVLFIAIIVIVGRENCIAAGLFLCFAAACTAANMGQQLVVI